MTPFEQTLGDIGEKKLPFNRMKPPAEVTNAPRQEVIGADFYWATFQKQKTKIKTQTFFLTLKIETGSKHLMLLPLFLNYFTLKSMQRHIFLSLWHSHVSSTLSKAVFTSCSGVGLCGSSQSVVSSGGSETQSEATQMLTQVCVCWLGNKGQAATNMLAVMSSVNVELLKQTNGG